MGSHSAKSSHNTHKKTPASIVISLPARSRIDGHQRGELGPFPERSRLRLRELLVPPHLFLSLSLPKVADEGPRRAPRARGRVAEERPNYPFHPTVTAIRPRGTEADKDQITKGWDGMECVARAGSFNTVCEMGNARSGAMYI